MKKNLSVLSVVLSLCILFFSNTVINANAAVVKTYVNTYTKTTGLAVSPSVITELKSESQLDSFGESVRPANVIINIDDKMNVVASGIVLDTFENIYENKLNTKVIPNIYIKNDAQADALIEYLKVSGLLDVAVISDDASLVKKVRTQIKYIRGILDYTKTSLLDIGALVSETNMSYANIVILGKNGLDRKVVEYFQSRLKAVWLYTESEEFDIFTAISTGAYGIIVDNFQMVYQCFSEYESGSLARSFFNIAHRGMVYIHNENSLEGFIASYQSGATHIELDVKITKDKQIIVMHDDDISRTTNGTGNINNMTLSELKNFKITKTYDGKVTGVESEIPTLKEVFDYFKGKDIVIVVEIKNTYAEFCSLLRPILEEAGVWNQIVVISFDKNQLMRMRNEIPEIPCATLNSYGRSDFADALMEFGTYNTVPNPSYGSFDYDFLTKRNNKDRGYMSFNWTYDNITEMKKGIAKGILGLTNNYPDKLAKFPKFINCSDNLEVESAQSITNAKLLANVISYDLTATSSQCEVFKYKDMGSYALAILSYTSNGYTIYSSPIKVDYTYETAEPSEKPNETQSPHPIPSASSNPSNTQKNGCGGNLQIAFPIIFAVCLVMINLITKYKAKY